jgi:hypothetical protein
MPNKYIESPERMWELFTMYKEWVRSQPIMVQDFVGKDGSEVHRERQRPMIMEGFECFVMDHTKITYPDLTEYFEGKNESYRSFFPICSRIRREIRQDHLTGGMVGIYNPSITQRLNGLVDKIQEDGTKKVIIEVVDGDTENKSDRTNTA